MKNSILNRVKRAISVFNSKPLNIEQLSDRIDEVIQEKQNPRASQLDIRHNNSNLVYSSTYNMLSSWVGRMDEKSIPDKINSSAVDIDPIISEFWKLEPILAGAVYSMCAKMTALSWTVTGKRLKAINSAKILARAAYGYYGYDWSGFISSVAEDYYTTNRGVFIETAKDGNPIYGKLLDIGHIDSLACTLTGNSYIPMIYTSGETGQQLQFKPGEYIHFASLPSPREYKLGAGFCSVGRAYRAAKLLIGLADYDFEKLNNLPPEGVASVTGLTMEEFEDAINLWKVKRKQDSSLTFPQVLWLIGSQPNAAVSVQLTGFSQLPESFDRKTVVEQYVNTLALDFGVDAREFWSINAGNLGSGAESEVQHLKAKGKGPGEFISTAERHINGELDEETDFSFDTQDVEEDANAAAIAKAWIDAYFPLYNLPIDEEEEAIQKQNNNPDPPDGSPKLPVTPLSNLDTGGAMGINEGGQSKQASQVITKSEFMRLLADKNIIPGWMITDQRISIRDNQFHNYALKELAEADPDNYITMKYDKGKLTPIRPYIQLDSKPSADKTEVVVKDFNDINDLWQYLVTKADELITKESKIKGTSIPESESLRGNQVTTRTIHDELERWRAHPILAKYAPSLENEKIILNKMR